MANYPGTFYGDISIQYKEYINHTVSRSFPVFHTYLIGYIIQKGWQLTGDYNFGIALCTFVQMSLLALVFTWIIHFFKLRYTGKKIVAVLWLGFAFSPVIQLFCRNLVRDVLFSMFSLVLGFIIYLLLYETDTIMNSQLKVLLVFIALFITLNLRNVAFLFFIGVLFCLLFNMKGNKKRFKKVFLLFIALFIVEGIYYNFVLDKISIKNSEHAGVAESGIKESLSVPIQQVVRTTNLLWEELEEEDKAVWRELFPEEILIAGYDDDNADVPKVYFNQAVFMEKPFRYVKEWISLGGRYPGVYLDAFLDLNCEVWYPDSILDGYTGMLGGECLYSGSGTAEPGYTDSKIPSIYAWEEKINHTISFSKVPLVSLLFSPAFMLYIMLYAAFYLHYRGNSQFITIILPAIILHLGTLFCPVVSVRYNLISFITAPVALALIIAPKVRTHSEIN